MLDQDLTRIGRGRPLRCLDPGPTAEAQDFKQGVAREAVMTVHATGDFADAEQVGNRGCAICVDDNA